ncbi:STAS domain-containing protein [Dyella jiangningensis]|uniref:Anti-sigma factor antagonist n=1 Tax=Dyella jiangningensis TaxID=1379159 RepID=A0A328P5S0_9GAMM|nr:STAS domain-containing protein [Dyella jiangningensis]RAO77339.1 anti-sigma F factor antagonist [Dyella jiangningensis]
MTLSLSTESESPDRTTLHLHGRLDAQTFGEFDLAALDLLPRVADGGTVVLDLSALDYISSAGLRSIAKIRKSMRARGGHTLLLNPQPQVQKVFEIVKAVPVNEVFASARELDAYLDHMQRQITGDSIED